MDAVRSFNHIDLCANLSRIRDTSLYRTDTWIPVVSTIERFHSTYIHMTGPGISKLHVDGTESTQAHSSVRWRLCLTNLYREGRPQIGFSWRNQRVC